MPGRGVRLTDFLEALRDQERTAIPYNGAKAFFLLVFPVFETLSEFRGNHN